MFMALILNSCSTKEDCDCGRVLSQGRLTDSTYCLEVQNFCTDSVNTFTLNQKDWNGYIKSKKEGLLHRGFNYYNSNTYCK